MGKIHMKYFSVCASDSTGTNFSGESIRSLNILMLVIEFVNKTSGSIHSEN